MRKSNPDYACLPFWSWNDELEPEHLEEQVAWMKEQGVGGFFMHARGGLTTPYLGEEWFACIEASGKKARELGMAPYAYDENGWPSGFAGGLLLKDPENHDQCVRFSYGPYDEKAAVSYDYHGKALRRVTSGKDVMNVYIENSPSTADILNPEVVKKFLSLTHEQYRKRDDYGLRGFFTDEPQYFRWGTAYTRVMPAYFKKQYGEDLLDGLGLLFVEKEGYRAFRYRYWLSMQHLMIESWAKQIYHYCEEHHYELTGHYVEENSLAGQMLGCAGVMPFYQYEQMPGIDWLGRGFDEGDGNELAAKQLGSVAAQTGKKQTICEMFACCGWDVTPLELKKIAEFLYANGVNRMCQHLLPYGESGQRKRDYPSHFSAVNPWIEKGFREFNDYFSILGETLSKSTESPSCAMLQPIRSVYFDFKRDDMRGSIGALDDSFLKEINDLGARQIPHHLVDETILEGMGSVEGTSLRVGKMSYSYLILPSAMKTMGKKTEELLRAYVHNGGKILLLGKAPEYLEGEPHDYPYLKSNCTIEEIQAAAPFQASYNSHVSTTYRVSDEGKPFLFAANRFGPTKVSFHMDGYSSFEAYDILSDSYSRIGMDVDFAPGQSYLLYPSREEAPKQAGKPGKLPLKKRFAVTKPVPNFLTLDEAYYSYDGKNFQGPYPTMGIFDLLLKARYQGPLFVRYPFRVEEVPESCLALVETPRLKKVFVNGREAKMVSPSPYERKLGRFDASPFLKKGENEVTILLDYFQKQEVYDVLFGNGTESLLNCLSYDSNVEAIYLEGPFGVFGKFENGSAPQYFHGSDFVIGRQPTQIEGSLVKSGFPFFRGEISLSQEVSAESENLSLSLGERIHYAEVEVNGEEAGHLMLQDSLPLSPHLKKGMNRIEIALTVGNRNLLGPSHSQVDEDTILSPYTFELRGSWENGHSPLYREGLFTFVEPLPQK